MGQATPRCETERMITWDSIQLPWASPRVFVGSAKGEELKPNEGKKAGTQDSKVLITTSCRTNLDKL